PKRPKPAVAPKPCLPRSSGSSSPPVSPPSTEEEEETHEKGPEDSGVPTEAQTAEQTAACDVAGNILTSIHPLESSQAEEQTFPISTQPDLPVPAAPSKPLPVPHPRKFKKPALVRQDGVEGQDQAVLVEEQKNETELQQADDSETQTDSCLVDLEMDVPVPPPRQTSLSPSLHRTVRCLLNKNTSHSLDLLSRPDSKGHGKEAQQENEEEDGYGDFERYPISHTLPKQLKLGCHRKALSAEDQQSPRAPPRKPQRHSLPATPPPSVCPPAPPHASTPMRDLPPPPQERAAWRFSRPYVTFFSRQIPTRSSVPPKSRAPALGGKQRAQSFSAADLATRAGSSQKRSLSLRKLLELRLNVKMLPKLLAKGGQSLDCTSTDKSLGRPSSCIEDPDIHREDVEYENVPLYEEIPEYINLPFHGARLGWSHDPDGGDANIYEVQDPFHRCSEHEYERWVQTTAPIFLLFIAFQQEDEMKRKKVVHIAQEIMSSEKDFRDAVAKATRQNGKPVVGERILSQILYYLPQLYQLNKDLLRELEDRVAHWSDHQRLSDIFVQKGPYLKMYSTYIRQFDNNVALLDEQCRKNPALAAVVREFEMSPRCANLALKHYLLKPVQRIPQYQLLLTGTDSSSSSSSSSEHSALSVVKEVTFIPTKRRLLNGQHEIVQPGRVFLKEGTLMKLSRKVMQPRMFFLFNDALMYTTPVQSAQYKLNSVLSLAGMKVSKPSQEAYQNELNIESVERSFILSASSAKERDEWLEAIGKAIEDYTKKKITFISSRSQEEAECVVDSGAPLGSKAPIWIPDLRATMCMICTCEFTLTWRRHHCRACGKVVCQACSTNKYYLEYLKNQPARVCDHCFAKLQENTFSFTRKQKKIPAALKEVSANTENSSMSGYLHRSKGNKKQWKRLWFVIKNKVLYTYAASEDVAALESQPLLGFFLREEKNGPAQKLQFKLYHKNTLFYIFKADDIPTAQRWIEAFQEAMILEQ
uniref:FYVE, RhoGEF and PH domain containing 6 n=1 Tax=Xiphophorus couchianus TaxID=32473 RepID=A0A3B5MEW4_9TELE